MIFRGVVGEVSGVKVRAVVPAVAAGLLLPWAEPCVPFGWDGHVPALDDPVWIMFENGDKSHPVWVGTWEPRRVTSHPPAGSPAFRPFDPKLGESYYDLELLIPIWWQGSNWVDVDGTVV